MTVPDWAKLPNSINPQNLKLIANAQTLNGKSIYLTDARGIGVMLRDRRLTLRDHAAITRFIVEAISDTDFLLQAADVKSGSDWYVRPQDNNAFYARGSRDEAQRFQISAAEFGLELYLEGQRPAVFDHDHDVSIGKWTEGCSFIPVVVHDDLKAIWPTPSQGGGSGGNGRPARGRSP